MERTPPTVGGQQPTLELPPSANDPSKFLNVFTDLPEDQFSLAAVFLKNNPQVSDSGLANLARISGLVELILDGAKVTDAGLVHLKQLKNLTFLFLAHTRVSDDGILHLKDLKSLASVDRTKTLVTDASIDALVACEKPRSASLRGTKVTELGAKRLAAKPSDCKVEWDGGMIEHRRSRADDCANAAGSFPVGDLGETVLSSGRIPFMPWQRFRCPGRFEVAYSQATEVRRRAIRQALFELGCLDIARRCVSSTVSNRRECKEYVRGARPGSKHLGKAGSFPYIAMMASS